MTRLAFIHDLNDVIEAVCRRVLSHADGAVRRRLTDLITGAGKVGQDSHASLKTQNFCLFSSSNSLRHTLPKPTHPRHQSTTAPRHLGQKTPVSTSGERLTGTPHKARMQTQSESENKLPLSAHHVSLSSVISAGKTKICAGRAPTWQPHQR
jgi:hypothetical protein